MSTTSTTLPASAGANDTLHSSLAVRLQRAGETVAARLRAWAKLRRDLAEIQSLSDRELLDIGLADGEVHHLRQGNVFCPLRWRQDDSARV